MNFAVLGRLLWQASLIPKILDFNSLDIMYVVLIKNFDLIDRMYLKAHFGPFSPKTLDSNFLHIIYVVFMNRVHPSDSNKLKCHCNEKTVNPIVIVKEQHLQTRLNGVFSFSIPCFVSEIFRFLKHAN